MRVSSRIVADIPTTTPGLGFNDYAEALAETISSSQPARFTIGLYGRWGSGKSSLLEAIGDILGRDSLVTVVRFDAWRYQRTEEIVVPLLHAVLEAVRQGQDASLAKSMLGLVRAFGLSLSFRIPIVGADFSVSDVKEAWHPTGAASEALDEVFSGPYDELKRVGAELEGHRIVVLIDDLDRCTADRVVSMLESINVITDVAGFIFVLALDYDVLVSAVQSRYPTVSGHQFIEKIIQVPFRIPRLDAANDSSLDVIIPDFGRLEHLVELRVHLQLISNLAFEGNPRSIKRFINALTLSMRILSARGVPFGSELLCAVLAAELRWPEEFQDVRTAVNSGDPDPLKNLRDSENPSLRAFAETTLPPTTAEDLLPLLRLTASTASPKVDVVRNEDEEIVASRTDRGRLKIADALLSLGFIPSVRNDNLLYHPALLHHRVLFAKQVVRTEQDELRSGRRRWDLHRSFRLASEADEAITFITRLLELNQANSVLSDPA